MFIYKITNSANGKSYVGQTRLVARRRVMDHFAKLRSAKHKNKHLQNAWNKYGESAFSYKVIDTATTLHQLDFLESYWILFYKSNDCSYGYNAESGGNSLKQCGPAWNKGLPKEQQARFGKKHTEETKEMMAAAASARVYSEAELALARANGAKMSKPIYCNENGKTYESRSQAARELNITRENIAPVLAGRKKSVGGYTFRSL